MSHPVHPWDGKGPPQGLWLSLRNLVFLAIIVGAAIGSLAFDAFGATLYWTGPDSLSDGTPVDPEATDSVLIFWRVEPATEWERIHASPWAPGEVDSLEIADSTFAEGVTWVRAIARKIAGRVTKPGEPDTVLVEIWRVSSEPTDLRIEIHSPEPPGPVDVWIEFDLGFSGNLRGKAKIRLLPELPEAVRAELRAGPAPR